MERVLPSKRTKVEHEVGAHSKFVSKNVEFTSQIRDRTRTMPNHEHVLAEFCVELRPLSSADEGRFRFFGGSFDEVTDRQRRYSGVKSH